MMHSFAMYFILSVMMVTSSASVLQSRDSSYDWRRRVNATLEIVRSQNHCLFSRSKCIAASRVPMSKMNLYTAEASSRSERLVVILPDKYRVQKNRRRSNTDQHPDAVVAIDPFPQASFGHIMLVFNIFKHKDEAACKRIGGTFTAFLECIVPAKKRNCHNTIERKRRRCEIDFIPLVYSSNNLKERVQKLRCRDDLLNFGKCRVVDLATPAPCENTPRCGNPLVKNKKFCFYHQCDYAVLIGGAWNPQTSHPRYKKNLELVWNFLHKENNFSAEHITTFYGHDGGIELDGNATTQDAVPAVNEISPRARVKNLCALRSCVDTLFLYLTGPARSNGALLFWDENNDGLIEDKEEYSFHDLKSDLKNCEAKKIFVVADYSYSGQLIHKFPSKRLSKKVVMLSSTSQHEYTWRNEFTKTFIESARSGRARGMREIFEVTKRSLSQRLYESHPQMTSNNKKIANMTIYGGPSNAVLEKKGCQVLRNHQSPRYRKPKQKKRDNNRK